jgi:hypothetical protein
VLGDAVDVAIVADNLLAAPFFVLAEAHPGLRVLGRRAEVDRNAHVFAEPNSRFQSALGRRYVG